ncbi:MAG: SEC-C metal-binding domain-containing protein, partial [Steroidobacteraceae bacterium]
QRERMMQALQAQHAEAQSVFQAPEDEPVPDFASLPPPDDSQGTFVRGERKVGRNEPCPCGSGRKYKQCHGLLSA